jgi:hypothetical protein
MQPSYPCVGARTLGSSWQWKSRCLGKKGSAKTFTGPEPVFGITKATTCRSISAWIKL